MSNSEDWKWLRDKVEKIDSRMDDQASNLNRLTASVEYHVRRTDQLENHILAVQKELEPIKNHVAIFSAIGKLIGVAGVLIGIIKNLF
jgi:hypothetical protein